DRAARLRAVGRGAGGGRRTRCGRGRRRGRRLGGLARLRLGGGLRGLGGGEDVLLADAATDAGPGDGREVDGVLGRELAHERGDVRGGAAALTPRRTGLGLVIG